MEVEIQLFYNLRSEYQVLIFDQLMSVSKIDQYSLNP